MLTEKEITGEKTLSLDQLRRELEQELNAILAYWSQHVVDQREGFYGSVDNENNPDFSASKGLVMNSRILWAFAAGFRHTKNPLHLQMATRAFQYLAEHFVDRVYGGAFWSLDPQGTLHDGKKQIYGLAFFIYGLSEYYRASNNKAALEMAGDLFDVIEKYSVDREKGGYVEAFARNWEDASDLRLSDKDDNERKTTNTHLHVLEAYANFYSVAPRPVLHERIVDLLNLFDRHMIGDDGHLRLFFDDNWKPRSSLVSFGHDIEASWLLLQCAEVIDDSRWVDLFRKRAVQLADAAARGLDADGGLWYELDAGTGHLIREKHSWPQAEALAGFFNAWQLTGDDKYLQAVFSNWEFIKQHIRDDKNGEWYWGVEAGYSIMKKDKAGFWKCPYHNSRACLELIRRISAAT